MLPPRNLGVLRYGGYAAVYAGLTVALGTLAHFAYALLKVTKHNASAIDLIMPAFFAVFTPIGGVGLLLLGLKVLRGHNQIQLRDKHLVVIGYPRLRGSKKRIKVKQIRNFTVDSLDSLPVPTGLRQLGCWAAGRLGCQVK